MVLHPFTSNLADDFGQIVEVPSSLKYLRISDSCLRVGLKSCLQDTRNCIVTFNFGFTHIYFIFQVGLIFKKKSTDIDVAALERKLKKAKREKPKSVQLYNQIGNFWRLKGDTYKSIECFRRALAVSPHNAEVSEIDLI